MTTTTRAYYFDSSALLKRYINEQGSAYVRALMMEQDALRFVAQIAGVEVVSAITRQAAGKFITPRVRDVALSQFRRDFRDGYAVVAITGKMIARAMDLAEKRALRSCDAVQLSAAISIVNRAERLDVALVFVCADNALNEAARLEGLAVANPNDHS